MSAGLLFDTIAESDPIARGKALCHRYCERAGKADDNQQLKHHKEEENHYMVESRKINVNILITPTILGLVILATFLVGGAGVNYYLAAKENRMTSAYLGYAHELQTLSQEIAKNSKAATEGQVAIFDVLAANRSDFDAILGYLINGNQIMSLPASPEDTKTELDLASALWGETRTQIDDILNSREEMVSLRDIVGDLAITMSAIQLDNNKIVATMLLTNAPANQVALAQRQTQLIERMSRSLDKITELGTNKALADSFSRDSVNFSRVLEGMANGNKELLLTPSNNADVQDSLTRIDELFRPMTARMAQINAKSLYVAEMKKSAESIFQSSVDARDLFSSLAARYESTRGKGIKSPHFGIGCVIAALMMLATICLLIYRKAKKFIGETSYQNEKNQAAILQLLGELADLDDGDLRVQTAVIESSTEATADSITFSIDQVRQLVSKIKGTSTEVSTNLCVAIGEVKPEGTGVAEAPRSTHPFKIKPAAEVRAAFEKQLGRQATRKIRQRYQQALIALLKKQQPRQNLNVMGKTFSRLVQICGVSSKGNLFRVALAAAEGISTGAIKLNAHTAEILKRVDAELKDLINRGASSLGEVSGDLGAELLKLVNGAKRETPRIADVKSSFFIRENSQNLEKKSSALN